jgi:(p)ppGpp synthase/HD superfamily hydrolase
MVAGQSQRFEAALVYAAQLHEGQKRKGTEIPYIAHLLAVTALVLGDGGVEDEAIAALLHDGPEDRGGRRTLEKIGERFGERVARIVEGCSDTLESPKPKWCPRKKRYLEHLETAPTDVLRVSLADKVDNARAIAQDFRVHGAAVWTRFNPESDQGWYYTELLKVFKRRSQSPLVQELALAVEQFAPQAQSP